MQLFTTPLSGTPKTRTQGSRGRGFNAEVDRWAERLLDLQRAGYVSPSNIAAKLNDDGVPTETGGRWSQSKVRRMLERGQEIGIPFVLWTRREAAARRRLHTKSEQSIAFAMSRRSAREYEEEVEGDQPSSLMLLLKKKPQ